MDRDALKTLYLRYKAQGIPPDQEERILEEMDGELDHENGPDSSLLPPLVHPRSDSHRLVKGLYEHHDQAILQGMVQPWGPALFMGKSMDDLLKRDLQREEDGLPRKIRVGKLIKPGKGGKDKVVVVPTTVEEKFIHDNIRSHEDEKASGGQGDGEEGEVIGEQPVRQEGAGEGGAGQGSEGGHEMESSAYDLGRILTQQFQLPNLKDKGKKRSLTRYSYDLTDKNRRFGQILDKKSTLKRILKTNIVLGNVPESGDIDPSDFVIAPDDKVYRVLSKEKDYESQAMVFFLRDYSGSMHGKPTELVVSQHVLIYSWLLFQYAKQVETRFVLHDTDAKEVPDFYTYYNSKVAGGTQVSSAYKLVNDIVEKESLARDYNIYVFHGTDGDDWDSKGQEAIPALKQMLTYANRVGITIASHSYSGSRKTEVENYIRGSGLLDQKADYLRLDVMQEDSDESRLIEGIKSLIS